MAYMERETGSTPTAATFRDRLERSDREQVRAWAVEQVLGGRIPYANSDEEWSAQVVAMAAKLEAYVLNGATA